MMSGCEPTEIYCGECANKRFSPRDGYACSCNVKIIDTLQKRIESLENQFKKLTEDLANINFDRGNRISQLEQERDQGVERLKKLEGFVEHWHKLPSVGADYFNSIIERLEALESQKTNWDIAEPGIEKTVRNIRFPGIGWKTESELSGNSGRMESNIDSAPELQDELKQNHIADADKMTDLTPLEKSCALAARECSHDKLLTENCEDCTNKEIKFQVTDEWYKKAAESEIGIPEISAGGSTPHDDEKEVYALLKIGGILTSEESAVECLNKIKRVYNEWICSLRRLDDQR